MLEQLTQTVNKSNVISVSIQNNVQKGLKHQFYCSEYSVESGRIQGTFVSIDVRIYHGIWDVQKHLLQTLEKLTQTVNKSNVISVSIQNNVKKDKNINLIAVRIQLSLAESKEHSFL